MKATLVVVCDQVNQVDPVHQVNKVDEVHQVHQVDPVHQVNIAPGRPVGRRKYKKIESMGKCEKFSFFSEKAKNNRF